LKADVILNATNGGLDLDCGGVSSVLLKAAGPALQVECTQKVPKKGLSQPGELVITSAYNLKSKKVYHGFIINWDNGTSTCKRVRPKCI